jgi:hypothetical protein
MVNVARNPARNPYLNPLALMERRPGNPMAQSALGQPGLPGQAPNPFGMSAMRPPMGPGVPMAPRQGLAMPYGAGAPAGNPFLRGAGSILGRGPTGAMGALEGILGQGQAGGYFDPSGSPRLREALRRRALQGGDAQRRRAAVMSRLHGLSPEQARVAMLDADMGATQGTADAMNEGELQQLLGGQDWFRQLFSGQLDFQRQQMLQKEAARQAKEARGSPWGQILGAGLGAVLPF